MKMTGFARFFIVMLFLVPAAYIGASYYNGEDGVQNIKELLGLDKKSDQETTTIQADQDQSTSSDNETIQDLRQQVQDLKSENEKLKAMIRNRDREIEELKNK